MAGRTGRPNKNRKESKYLLPSGVTLKPGQASVYNKTTELIFIDEEFGEFTSSFKAITRCNASTHPKAIQRRREATNTSKYGVANPSYSKEVRQKAADTMVERYGVTSALKSDTFKEKAKKTLIENYGVDNPSKKTGGAMAAKKDKKEGHSDWKLLEESSQEVASRPAWLQRNAALLFEDEQEKQRKSDSPAPVRRRERDASL